MTSATAGDRPGRQSRARRAAMWLGHYEPVINPVFDAALIGYVLTWIWLQARPPLVAVFAIVATGNLAAMFCGDLIHGRNLCPRDIDDTLLDPQGAVNKNLRRLQWAHGTWPRRLGLIASLTVIALLVTVPQLAHLPWPVRAVASVLAVVAGVAVTYGALSLYTHRRLQPWCPWCQHGGGGPRSHVTAPDPQPVGTRDS